MQGQLADVLSPQLTHFVSWSDLRGSDEGRMRLRDGPRTSSTVIKFYLVAMGLWNTDVVPLSLQSVNSLSERRSAPRKAYLSSPLL